MTYKNLTHFDAAGQAHMVDIATKADSKRVAVARGKIHLSTTAFDAISSATNKKGDVLGVARIAAIQASKQTSSLIPLCHSLALTKVAVEFQTNVEQSWVEIIVTAETVGKTGVEMEALTATSVGLLTIYDMLKAIDKGMRIDNICLQSKTGGKSGDWQR